jgi:hypothetical protein
MPSCSAGALRRCFTSTLQATLAEGARHEQFDFFDDADNLVASTVLSRGWKSSTSLSVKMVSAI